MVKITIIKNVHPFHEEPVTFKDGTKSVKHVGCFEITEEGEGIASVVPQATVETFAKTTEWIVDGAVLDAEKREGKWGASYSVKRPQTGAYQSGGKSGGKQWTPQPKIDLEHYRVLYKYLHNQAVNLAGKEATSDVIATYFDRLLSCASVMLDLKVIQESSLPGAPKKITNATSDEIATGTAAAKVSDAFTPDTDDDDCPF